jgi:hypothetical protein
MATVVDLVRVAGSWCARFAKAAHVGARLTVGSFAWAESTIDDNLQKHGLALKLAWLNELQQVLYRCPIDDGNVQSGLLVTKIIERRGVMLGSSAPQAMTLRIIEGAASTTIDRTRRALEELAAKAPVRTRTRPPTNPPAWCGPHQTNADRGGSVRRAAALPG